MHISAIVHHPAKAVKDKKKYNHKPQQREWFKESRGKEKGNHKQKGTNVFFTVERLLLIMHSASVPSDHVSIGNELHSWLAVPLLKGKYHKMLYNERLFWLNYPLIRLHALALWVKNDFRGEESSNNRFFLNEPN